ncbi:hypothetical protein NVS89_04480 [Ancylobacter sp. MQZ15Z-1]|uniref:Uncharacterized protein n=1 Tax=Ancylobacter mangrovi TaxID=2972472 RepID=A0A9X2PDX0_9HYPH|nr:methylamine utilization protein MauJ [Ancylobacter mangrovi]MCS0494343.1 hypothetical protein [Ancylobacter mangrovi]
MFAKNLEYVLQGLTADGDFQRYTPRDVEERFENLRDWGRLPRGREKRAQHLTRSEITAAVFGLVPVHPAWAGHAAVVFEKLRPVGGPAASFRAAPTLSDAIQFLLADEASAAGVIDVTLTGSGFGTNNNGFATLRYVNEKALRAVHFVSKMAVSLLQPGAEVGFRPESFGSTLARNVVLTERFFRTLRREVDKSMLSMGGPAGDGSEYTAEEARAARAARLGAKPHSRFLNMGIDTQVTWPKEETRIAFDRYYLVLMPKTEDHMQSVHIDLMANRLTDEAAMTVINRFLSLLTWCDDQFAVAQHCWSGNPVPVAVSKPDLPASTAQHWVFNRQIPSDAKVLRALGHYREARNADHAGLASYAVLSYYKVIEGGQDDDGSKVKAWITKSYPIVNAAHESDRDFTAFREAVGTMTPQEYLTNECRRAAAHASRKSPSDVDDLDETRRLFTAASVLHALARHMISHEFGVSDRR